MTPVKRTQTNEPAAESSELNHTSVLINAELPLIPRMDVVVQVVSNQGNIKRLRRLLDTGCTKTVFLKDFLEENNMKKSKKPIRYGTYAKSFTAD